MAPASAGCFWLCHPQLVLVLALLRILFQPLSRGRGLAVFCPYCVGYVRRKTGCQREFVLIWRRLMLTASNKTVKHAAVVVQPLSWAWQQNRSGVDGPSRGQAPSCPACSCPRASGAPSSYRMESCNTANPTRAQVGPKSLISVTWEISETFLEALFASRICRRASGVLWIVAQGLLRLEKGEYEECANPASTCLKFTVIGAGDWSCQVIPSGLVII